MRSRLLTTMRACISLGLLFLAPDVGAQPTHISYQGSLLSNGSPYTGSANFKFAIVDGATTLWSNDGTSTAGSEPTGSVPLNVDGGIFTVLLGDVAASMVALTSDALGGTATADLRVWVDTGGGFDQLSDQSLSSSPFALHSDTAERALGDFAVNGDLAVDSNDWTSVNLSTTNAASLSSVDIKGSGSAFLGLRMGSPSLPGTFAGISRGGLAYLTASGGPMAIGPQSPDVLYFVTNNAERVRITSDGAVGIGVTSPQQDLHVSSAIQIGSIETISDAGANLLEFAASLRPSTDGGWLLGSSTNRWSAVWAVDGTINTSDLREKKNVEPLQYGLSHVMRLEPVSYEWKDFKDSGRRCGLSAQNLLDVIPEAVRTHETQLDEVGNITATPVKHLGVQYSAIIPVLVKAIQDQQDTIEELEQRIAALEQR